MCAFLDYVDAGIVAGNFVAELDDAVDSIKFNKKVRHDFMTFQMYLLEEKMASEQLGEQRGLQIDLPQIFNR